MIEAYVDLILKWAKQRGIFLKGTKKGQADKMLEEAQELWKGVYTEDIHEIKDGIGDVFVTLVILAKMHGLSLEDCINYAYQQIKNRKGKMVDGKFVKEM